MHCEMDGHYKMDGHTFWHSITGDTNKEEDFEGFTEAAFVKLERGGGGNKSDQDLDCG